MDATLDAITRETRGKNEARRLRVAGKIPAVVYGTSARAKKGDKAPQGTPVAVDPKALLKILHSDSGANTLINLKLEGGASRVMVREYQLDPVTHHLLHADFYRLAMDREITVTIPVHVIGESKGVKLQGGIVDFVTREIQVQCLPADIPDGVTVDVTELMLNQSIRVRELPEHPKWKPVTEGETMIVHVVTLKVEAEPTPADGAAPAAAAEPEVVKKGKTDKEGAEPAAKDKK